MKHLGIIPGLLLLAACSGTPLESARLAEADAELNDIGVTVTLDSETYSPGDAVVMRVVNGSTDTLGYNPCGSRSVERATGGQWAVHSESQRTCTLELHYVLPGQTVTGTTQLPRDLQTGTHRMVLTFDVVPSGGTISAASPTFRVGGR